MAIGALPAIADRKPECEFQLRELEAKGTVDVAAVPISTKEARLEMIEGGWMVAEGIWLCLTGSRMWRAQGGWRKRGRCGRT